MTPKRKKESRYKLTLHIANDSHNNYNINEVQRIKTQNNITSYK
jgi:hypothetical protein